MAERLTPKSLARGDDFGSEALDLIEITGVIKWFDVAKGFGFIVPTTACRTFWCMSPACAATGSQTVLEGARIVALIQKRDRGYQAFRILSIDQSTAVHPSQLPTRAHPCSGQAHQRAWSG